MSQPFRPINHPGMEVIFTGPLNEARDPVSVHANFMEWLFATFETDPKIFRNSVVAELRITPGSKILITGCGLGDEVMPVRNCGASEIVCIDISGAMIDEAKRRVPDPSVRWHIGDACFLEFQDSFFDGALHFGGLNEFKNRGAAIHEMARVVKHGGRVVFGDEGVAPWLRETDYARMAINNNHLWAQHAPLDLLPFSATDVSVKWILGNCFYLVSFTVDRNGPHMNPDIAHTSPRGGTMRSRYESR